MDASGGGDRKDFKSAVLIDYEGLLMGGAGKAEYSYDKG
jgi:hypothetical protein